MTAAFWSHDWFALFQKMDPNEIDIIIGHAQRAKIENIPKERLWPRIKD